MAVAVRMLVAISVSVRLLCRGVGEGAQRCARQALCAGRHTFVARVGTAVGGIVITQLVGVGMPRAPLAWFRWWCARAATMQ